jgi:hypothetical protein
VREGLRQKVRVTVRGTGTKLTTTAFGERWEGQRLVLTGEVSGNHVPRGAKPGLSDHADDDDDDPRS